MRQLKASTFKDFEILVADDASPAASEIQLAATEEGAQLVRLARRSGPAAARNAAAKRARGEILVFMDADTSAHPDTLERIAREFESNPKLDAVIGSYDQRPSAPFRVSRFRNLLHSFVHHRAKRKASTFWAGCGAVRRDRFRAVGGFDETFSRPCIEDVEFGLRLRDSGACIEMHPAIQVTHHKAWTLRSMIWTDLFSRAIPWTGMMRRYPLPLDLNFTTADRVSVALTGLTGPAILLALLHGGVFWLAPVLTLTLVALLNRPLFRFLARSMGWRDAVLSFPFLLTYFGTCLAGLLGGLVLAESRRDRYLLPSAAVIGVALLTLQLAGGAYTAQFDAEAEEAAHFVSGLMTYDYAVTLPRENPIHWAGQYYLHYPRVVIGHWPPGYYAIEAAWWLFFSPSRISVMLLQWIIGFAALTVLYRICRFYLSLPITAGIIAFTMAAPAFQQSLELTMADLCCFLWSVLTMGAVVRLLERRDKIAFFFLGLWLVAAALTKGIVVCLAPVPILAIVYSGERVRVPTSWIVAGGLALSACAAWYFAVGGVITPGGIPTGAAGLASIGESLVGWGFVALAAFGLRRNPLAIAAACMIVSILGVSLVVRAIQEERHWIILLPAIMVLAGFAVSSIRKPALAALVLLPAIALFPFSFYHQPHSGYRDLLSQLHRPARMLVSSNALGEGAWVAMTSVSEPRPSSFIVRASKVLVEQGWNGENYRLRTPNSEAVLRRLDELDVSTVVLHTIPNRQSPPHHLLLQNTIPEAGAWSPCAKALDLIAYCRVKPPEYPRQALHLQLYGWDFTEQISRP